MNTVIRVLAFFAMLAAARAGSYFMDAREAYDLGKFEEAKRIYEQGIEHGPVEANVLINHGNTCFRLGDLGHAALSYERALVALPSHPDANENLKFVRNRAGSRIGNPSWQEYLLSAVPRRVAPWLAMGAAWAGCVWGAIAFARRRTSGIIGAVVLFALGSAYAAGLIWLEARLTKAAIVVAAKAEARSEPADRATIAESLPAGSRVRVIGERGAWKFCDLPSGGRGWLPAETVERIFPASS